MIVVAAVRGGYERLRAATLLWATAAAFVAWTLAATPLPPRLEREYASLTHLVTAAKFAEYALLAPLSRCSPDARDLESSSRRCGALGAPPRRSRLLQFFGVDIFERLAGRRAAAVVPRQPRLSALLGARRSRSGSRARVSAAARAPARVARRSPPLVSGGVGLILSGAAGGAIGLAARSRRARASSVGAAARSTRALARAAPRSSPSSCSAFVTLRGDDFDQFLRFVGPRPRTGRRRAVQTLCPPHAARVHRARIWLDHPVLGVGWQGVREYRARGRTCRRAPRASPDRRTRPSPAAAPVRVAERLRPGARRPRRRSGSLSSWGSSRRRRRGLVRALRAPADRRGGARRAPAGPRLDRAWAAPGSSRAPRRRARLALPRPRAAARQPEAARLSAVRTGRATGPARPSEPAPRPADLTLRAPLARWLRRRPRTAPRHGRFRLLDVGCGVEAVLPVLRAVRRASMSASTSSRPARRPARHGRGAPGRGRGFDVVLCTQVLEHCATPRGGPRAPPRRPRRAAASSPRPTACGLPPVARRSLALDARRPRAPLRAERRLGSVDRHPRRRHGHLPRDADRDLRRPARQARPPRRRRRRIGALNGSARRSTRRPRACASRGPGSLFANYHVVASEAR